MPMLLVPDTARLADVVRRSTGSRVRDVRVELRTGRVVLCGRATSYHAKQLALHGVRGVLPADQPVENAIVVDARPTGSAVLQDPLYREAHEVLPGLQVELPADAVAVRRNGLGAEKQPRGDLPRRLPTSDRAQHLQLAVG